MYSLKKMTQKISKTYTLSFPKAAHSLEAQDQGALPKRWDFFREFTGNFRQKKGQICHKNSDL